MDDIKELEDMRDIFQSLTNTTNELIALYKRSDNGEQVEDEIESVMGKYMIQLMKLQ